MDRKKAYAIVKRQCGTLNKLITSKYDQIRELSKEKEAIIRAYASLFSKFKIGQRIKTNQGSGEVRDITPFEDGGFWYRIHLDIPTPQGLIFVHVDQSYLEAE